MEASYILEVSKLNNTTKNVLMWSFQIFIYFFYIIIFAYVILTLYFLLIF